MITRRRRVALLVGLIVLGLAREAHADDAVPAPEPTPAADVQPPWHFRAGPRITSARGTVLDLPPGYYLSEPAFDKLDAELRRAQDAETRLGAENKSLRASARSAGFGFRTVAVIVAGAFAGGIAIAHLTSL